MASALDRFVLDRRGPKAPLDPARAYAALWEEEPAADGAPVSTAVVFLANRECPFRCLMCDLWRHTLDERLAPGLIPRQIREALASLPPARQVKLYNAGSFFDPDAVPPEDDEAIVRVVGGVDRVIVEAHPAFLRGRHAARALRLRDRIEGRLEVAIGLETIHAPTLARLNKRMTPVSFSRAAAFLNEASIALRVFLLLRPPFLSEAEGVEWACRSIDAAFDAGATACTVIPTRAGNGALEALGDAYGAPSLASLERVVEYGLGVARGRVFADLWDAARFVRCACGSARLERLARMNRDQRTVPPVECDACAA